MTPEAIVRMVTAGFECGAELLRFLQTPQGQAQVEQLLSDRAKWDSFWSNVGGGLKRFFSGEAFK